MHGAGDEPELKEADLSSGDHVAAVLCPWHRQAASAASTGPRGTAARAAIAVRAANANFVLDVAVYALLPRLAIAVTAMSAGFFHGLPCSAGTGDAAVLMSLFRHVVQDKSSMGVPASLDAKPGASTHGVAETLGSKLDRSATVSSVSSESGRRASKAQKDSNER